MKTIKKQLKRAFTIVELVIVIAVIAVLAAVLIPTFVNVLDSANESVDEQAVKNMNTALIADETLHGIPEDPKAAMEIIESAGYNVENYVAQLSTNTLYYDWTENRVLIWSTASNSVTYPSEMVEFYTNVTGVAANWYTLSNAYSTVKVGSDGKVTIDNTSMSVADAVSAAKEGETLILKLEADLTLSDTLTNTAGASITIDLGENELDYDIQKTTTITNGSTLYIKNGTMVDSGITDSEDVYNPANAVYNITAGSSITLENVEIESAGCVLYPKGDSAQVNIINSNITTKGSYCVATNAKTADNYGVIIRIENSTLEAKATDGDSCTVFLNVGGTLDISDSTIIGQKQAVLVRAGTANITNTNISCVLYYTASDIAKVKGYSQGGNWGSGNNLAFGAVVVGDTSNYSSAYNADANVTLTGCTISCTTSDYNSQDDDNNLSAYTAAIYATNQDTTYKTTVTLSDTTTITAGHVVNVSGGATINGYTGALTTWNTDKWE